MNRAFCAGWLAVLVALAGGAGCAGAHVDAQAQAPGGAVGQGAPSTGGASDAVAPGIGIAPTTPQVVLAKDGSAQIGATAVPFDGVAEGLAWPALGASVAHAPGALVVLGAARDVPIEVVLRAAWTLRDADVRVQTADGQGAVRVIDLAPKPRDAKAPSTGTCHLAVFVAGDGSLRIASPGGARLVAGPAPAESLARALADEGTRCPIRYVAYGAERPGTPWGAVFDVAWTVARVKLTGDARIVLAEPVHARK